MTRLSGRGTSSRLTARTVRSTFRHAFPRTARNHPLISKETIMLELGKASEETKGLEVPFYIADQVVNGVQFYFKRP